MKSWRYRLPVCLLFALLLTAAFGVCALADDEGTCGPNLAWKLEGDLLTISGTGPMDDFTEKETADRGVVSTAPWDEYQFSWIVIEEGVTSVGNLAFFNHVWVTGVELPDTLVSIGKDSFACCGMEEIRIPDSVRQIQENAFAICHNLKRIALPESVDKIEFGVFQSCPLLKDITLPSSIKTIDGYAFARCEALKEIYLPASVREIARDAFLSCANLQNVVVEKGSYAETYCIRNGLPYTYTDTPVASGKIGGDRLEWKLENGTLTISGTGGMDDYKRIFGGSEDTTAPWDGRRITQVVLEPGVTSVGDYAFWCCTQLKTVILPDSVTRIGKFAFEGCTLLREITLPAGVTEIGKQAFSRCGSLASIALPASVSTLGTDIFIGCKSLKEVVVEPGSYAEQYCVENRLAYSGGKTAPEATPAPAQSDIKKSNTCGENLTWKLENGILTISGTGRMDDYEQIDGAAGSSAPWSGSEYTAAVIEDGVASIGNYAFEGSGMTGISLPGTLVSLGQGAFEHCEKLETVTLPDSVTEIGMFAFCECAGLAEIRLSASLASIGAAAFQTCVKLTEITLPESVTNVGMYAFLNCAALKTVILPASLQMLGEYAFDGCHALKTVIVPKDSYAERYCARKGLAYIYTGSEPEPAEAVPTETPGGTCGKDLNWRLDDDGTLIISGSGEMNDYDDVDTEPDVYGNTEFLCTTAPWFGRGFSRVVVEEGVTRIGSYAFYQCEQLLSITLPDTLKSIGSCALGFTLLEDISLPDSVTSLGEELFFGCHSLEHVRLPAGLTIIPGQMFCGCDALREIDLPESLQRIETSAFLYCSGLTKITLPPALFYISGRAFEGCSALDQYIVTQGSYAEEYCAEKELPYVYTDGTIPDRETGKPVSGGVCGRNLAWTLENGTLTVSGSGAMDDYDEAMDGLYTLESTAPWGEKKISTVIVEEGVTSIGDYAFALQRQLTRVVLPDTLVSIGAEAFWDSNITELELPDSVRTIEPNAFSCCGNLRRVKLPAGIGGIEFGVFQNCVLLKEITLPDTVKTIGDYTFSGCTNLEKINFPASVKFFGEGAFDNCSNLVVTIQGGNRTAERYCAVNSLEYGYAENE